MGRHATELMQAGLSSQAIFIGAGMLGPQPAAALVGLYCMSHGVHVAPPKVVGDLAELSDLTPINWNPQKVHKKPCGGIRLHQQLTSRLFLFNCPV